MTNKLTGKCENVTFIKNIDKGLDLCEVQIDFSSYKIFEDSNDLMKYIGQDVLYALRPDCIDGKTEIVICHLAKLTEIQTVSSTENIKLVPEGTSRTVCNFNASEIRFGDFYPSCVALLSKVEKGSSKKAQWVDMTMIDQSSKEFTVKRFCNDADSVLEQIKPWCGHYVNFDLESTKYGFRTEEPTCMTRAVELSPEVEVAKQVLLNEIAQDEGLKKLDALYKYIDTLTSVIDGEPGYLLVRIASEIYMINAIDSISTDLDIRAMKRAAICSRGYALPHTTMWSAPLLNTNKALKIQELREDKELMYILDVFCEEPPSDTKLTYFEISELVDNIIKIRRGVKNEKGNFSDAGNSSIINPGWVWRR